MTMLHETSTPIANAAAAAARLAAPHYAPAEVIDWVAEVADLTQPARIHWCTGSEAEYEALVASMVARGTLIPLNQDLRPGSYLARSDASDVARVEERTFICSNTPDAAGPTNNWRHPVAMRRTLDELFDGAMRGRTMYVVPFSMGPVGGPISQLGIQLTDSPYAVVSMRIMTRMGEPALRQIATGSAWVEAVHSVGYPLIDERGAARDDVAWPCNETKYITHFPDELQIWSYGSGYGGNALLSKKCFALRLASVMARTEGWLAEHMLILKLTDPEGHAYHVTAAFPSACGKTNLAMLQPTIPGWRVETIGDDIAWLRPGPDGRLRAINPEAGFFGVAPGTGYRTNPVAMQTIASNTIFTNVALTPEGDVWWEGMTDEVPEALTDWQGHPWHRGDERPAAHPNARFTVSIEQCPTLADEWHEADGVPIDAILFGGRRASNVPLVIESRSWQHGVFIGATVSSEQTAAAEGVIGQLRRDPFGMLPFAGYHMADYWAHWLDVGARLGDAAPRIFQVNWFRKGEDGSFLWPGFGENSRVLDWIIRRVSGDARAASVPVGLVPARADFNTDGLELDEGTWRALFDVDPQSWLDEGELTEAYFDGLGERVPSSLHDELAQLRTRLSWHL